MSFSELNLNKNFIAAIEAAGYKKPTELQQRLIPAISKRKSVIIWTQTASGKTGSFLIPAISYILDNPLEKYKGTRILILTSRKDRVNQINYTVRRLATKHRIRLGFVVSGRPYQPQMRLLRRPLDLMVATPGRLSDLINNKKTNFSQLEMLVVDDLTSIYYKNLHPLLEKILADRKNDYPVISFVRKDKKVKQYALNLLPQVEEIDIEENSNPLLATPQVVYLADDYTHKIALVDYLLDKYHQKNESSIIYTSTLNSATSLVENLANHGHNTILIENKNDIKPFSKDENNIFILNDQTPVSISASNNTHIINFDLPRKIDNYISRITHKNGEKREDSIIALVNGKEKDFLRKIEKKRGKVIAKENILGLEPIHNFPTYSLSIQRKSEQFGNTGNQKNPSATGRKNQPKIIHKPRKNRFGRLNVTNTNQAKSYTSTDWSSTQQEKKTKPKQRLTIKKRKKITISYKEKKRPQI